VGAKVNTFQFRKTTYRVERIKEPNAHLIPVHFVLHDPRGRTYLVVPDKRRRDRFLALARLDHFSRYAPTPFAGTWFAVEDGKLVIAPPDA
jgi:hypothetical protein